jgi:predicted RNA binding protein YcfA (HicA-like mRNA interferase family)
MPRKVRELRADLRRAGFVLANTEGSHQTWRHPTGRRVILAGRDGADAQRYQEREVRAAIVDAEAATRVANAEKDKA